MSTDTPPPLYAAREPIFPRRVNGFFRRFKWWIMIVTLGIYYLTPWIRWDRGPSLPDQAVLIDMAGRRFYFFWIEIWPHEFYFVAGLLIMAGLGLFLFTSALGRVWCGYACPQTVWTDLFILVERWIEGDRNARIRLHRADWDIHKWRLRVTKWVVWLLIAVATGGAWVFYFADAPTLAADLFTFNAAPVAYITIAILTATTFIFGGFMREQVCIYMCPWPRIQGAMMDEGTLTVGYRDWRGEPRGRHRKGAKAAAATPQATAYATPEEHLPEADEHLGDCIDCMACVNVCPMGIDIRDGQQMECITCALCIDACDDVMAKIGKPRGLIDYLALDDVPPTVRGDLAPVRPLGTDSTEPGGVTTPVEGAARSAPYAGEVPMITQGIGDWKPKPVWKHILRPRTILYTVLWSLIGVGLVWALFVRSDIGMTVEPVRNPTFVTLSDGSVRNAYVVRLRNMTGEDRLFQLMLTSEQALSLNVEGEAADNIVTVPAQETLQERVYVTAEAGILAASQDRTELRLWVEDVETGERASRETTFNGRGQ